MWEYDVMGLSPGGMSSLVSLLVERGEAGWELVAVLPVDAVVSPDASKVTYFWVFKRPESVPANPA